MDNCVKAKDIMINNEYDSVKLTLETYVDGTRTGDVDSLKCIFHENAVMSGCLGDEAVVLSTPDSFFDDIKGREMDEGYEPQVVYIDITGNIASAVLIERDMRGMDFMNKFHLMKTGGQWKILSKLFTSI